jgi:hypothetical protein
MRQNRFLSHYLFGRRGLRVLELPLDALLALAAQQGHLTWRQLDEIAGDSDVSLTLLAELIVHGVELIEDPAEEAEKERAYQAHLAEMRRKPCWQLGDGWHFEVEADPYPCQPDVPTTFRLRCGYRPDREPNPEAVAFRVWAGPTGFAEDEPPEEAWQGTWVPIADRLIRPGEFRMLLPAGVVFMLFRVEQPDYSPKPWQVFWRLEVAWQSQAAPETVNDDSARM